MVTLCILFFSGIIEMHIINAMSSFSDGRSGLFFLSGFYILVCCQKASKHRKSTQLVESDRFRKRKLFKIHKNSKIHIFEKTNSRACGAIWIFQICAWSGFFAYMVTLCILFFSVIRKIWISCYMVTL